MTAASASRPRGDAVPQRSDADIYFARLAEVLSLKPKEEHEAFIRRQISRWEDHEKILADSANSDDPDMPKHTAILCTTIRARLHAMLPTAIDPFSGLDDIPLSHSVSAFRGMRIIIEHIEEYAESPGIRGEDARHHLRLAGHLAAARALGWMRDNFGPGAVLDARGHDDLSLAAE